MSDTTSVHVRLGPSHLGRLDAICKGQRVPPSRNEMARRLLEEALGRESCGTDGDGHAYARKIDENHITGLARRVRAARGDGSQAWAAEVAGVSEDQVRRAEQGKRVSAEATRKLLAWVERQEKRTGAGT